MLAPGRLDPPRGHAVDANLRPERTGGTPRERHHRPLCGREQFAAVALHAHGCLIPADRHDRAAVAVCHPAAEGPGERERGNHINGQERVEFAAEVPAGRLAGEHIGARDEHERVDGGQRRRRLGDQPFGGSRIGEVGQERARG